jgi:hypothetical protein
VGSGTFLVSPDGFERASRPGFPILKYVRVDLGRPEVLVVEEFLHGADVRAPFQEMRRKRMSESVTTGGLADPCRR